LETFGGAPGRGHQAGAIHVHGTHAVEEYVRRSRIWDCASACNCMRSCIPALEVALEKLAQDLEAHLQTDEALQRAIVEIRRDSLALRLAGLLRVLLHLVSLFVQLLDAG
jgi:hypothetical protein